MGENVGGTAKVVFNGEVAKCPVDGETDAGRFGSGHGSLVRGGEKSRQRFIGISPHVPARKVRRAER
jgi:hypothetical protein